MAADHIIALLIAERDKLNRAIQALNAPHTAALKSAPVASAPAPAKKTAKKTVGKRGFSPEQRAAQALKMKQYWAKKKKAAKKAP